MTPPQFAPPDYKSPFNLFLKGIKVAPVESRRDDVIYDTEHVLGIVCSRQFPGHEGHCLVFSKEQYQSIFDLPVGIGQEVFAATKLVSQALVSALGCDGVMIIQNNGQASDQTVFHYHVHVVPRWNGDKFLELYAAHSQTQKLMPADKRAEIGFALRMEIERLAVDNHDTQRSFAR